MEEMLDTLFEHSSAVHAAACHARLVYSNKPGCGHTRLVTQNTVERDDSNYARPCKTSANLPCLGEARLQHCLLFMQMGVCSRQCCLSGTQLCALGHNGRSYSVVCVHCTCPKAEALGCTALFCNRLWRERGVVLGAWHT